MTVAFLFVLMLFIFVYGIMKYLDYRYEKKMRNVRGSYADDGIWGS